MKYSSYKTIFVPLLLLFLLFAPKTWAQENQKQVPGLLINHHFFAKEMPMQEIFSAQKGFQRLDDGEQHSVLRVLVPANFVIPKAWKKYEIARENVVNADKFEAGARLFTLHDINGGTWTQDSLQGHVTVINVWYSGCGPCRKEMPELSTWKERFPQVTFLSADFEKPEKVRQITEKCNFNWTHLANDNYFTKWVGGRGYPMTLVLATDGTLQYMVNGTNEDIRKEIIKAIEKQVNTSKK